MKINQSKIDEMLAVEAANRFQEAMQNIKNEIERLESEIKGYGYEVVWYQKIKELEYGARKGNVDIFARSILAEGDEYNEYIGRIIALTRLITIVRKVEGEEDG